MREIKFRGKRLDNGEWVYGGIWINATGSRQTVYIIDDYGDNYAVDANTVGQYVGLKDCEGTKIYDGDIAAFGDGEVPTLVFLDDGKCNYRFKNLRRDEIYDFDKYSFRFIYKVIGNIHENPELLEVAK